MIEIVEKSQIEPDLLIWSTLSEEEIQRVRAQALKKGIDAVPVEEIMSFESAVDFQARLYMTELALFRVMRNQDFPRIRILHGSSLMEYGAVVFGNGSATATMLGVSETRPVVMFYRDSNASILDYNKGLSMIIKESNKLLTALEKVPYPDRP